MSWLENITPDELAVVEELKRRTIADASPKLLEDDLVFHRFCKARDFNLQKAEAMLRKHIQWRKDYQIETILQWTPPEVLRKYISNFRCLSKEGNVVRYVAFGQWDIPGLQRSSVKDDILRYFFYLQEQDDEYHRIQTKKAQPVFQAIIINDYTGVTLSTATNRIALEVIMAYARIFQDNYPERVHTYFHINAPHYFILGFQVVKTVLSSALLKKFKFYGKHGWKEDLLEVIEIDQLPAVAGGSTEFGIPLFTPCVSLYFGRCLRPESGFLTRATPRIWTTIIYRDQYPIGGNLLSGGLLNGKLSRICRVDREKTLSCNLIAEGLAVVINDRRIYRYFTDRYKKNSPLL